MFLICLAGLSLGAVLGALGALGPSPALEQASAFFLGTLTFGVGLQLGRRRGLLAALRGMGTRVLLVPAAVALGSVAAGTAAGVALGLPAADSAAASAGLAWYSLSAAVLTDLGGPMPGALALLVNLFRELIAFALTPLIARRMGFMEAIAPAGSTAMDTLLPVIARATDEQTALCAVICGFVLSAVMPLLATLLYRLL